MSAPAIAVPIATTQAVPHQHTDTANPYRPTRVAVLATDPLIHAGLHSMLTDRHGIELHGDLATADVVVAATETSLRELLAHPTQRLVLLADQPRKADLWLAVEHGLAVLLPRAEATPARLIKAIADARRGRGELPPEQLGRLLRAMSDLHRNVLAPRDLGLDGLSQREADILRLLADGLDTAQIATQLSYSERTVKNVLYGLLTRLNVTNRTHAVAYAVRHGLI